MNFFGHAAVASWSSESHAVFGAMAPDFASMAGVRLATTQSPPIARGIALHHATDAVFHGSAPVVALMRALDDELAAGGCARGPRKATAHVGIELLLDGVLVDDPRYRAAYLDALATADELALADGDAPRLAHLLSRLRSHGVPDDLRRCDAITRRLERTLAPRPLLRADARDLVVIERALVALRPRVVDSTDTILAQLRGVD